MTIVLPVIQVQAHQQALRFRQVVPAVVILMSGQVQVVQAHQVHQVALHHQAVTVVQVHQAVIAPHLQVVAKVN